MPNPDTTLDNFLTALNNPIRDIVNIDTVMAQFNGNPTVGITTDGTDRPTYSGRTAVRKLFEALFTAFPDFKAATTLDPMHVVEPPTRIVVQARLGGTHKGIWNPGKDSSHLNNANPTNKQFLDLPACAIFTFDGTGLISNLAIYFDRSVILNQLGIP